MFRVWFNPNPPAETRKVFGFGLNPFPETRKGFEFDYTPSAWNPKGFRVRFKFRRLKRERASGLV